MSRVGLLVGVGMASIGVSGATGRLGGRVATRLELAGVSQRLLVRDLSRAPQLSRAEAVAAPWTDTGSLVKALAGLDTVLMLSASEAPDRLQQHYRFVDAAVEAGVRHLAYTSFVGAAADAVFTLARDHHATERHIEASGLSHTFLGDNLYADFLLPMVGEDGVIRGPAGSGRVAAVAQDDIADVAAAILQNPAAHEGCTYDLTGPEALTLDDVASIITEVTGSAVRYHPETVEAAYASRRRHNAPYWELDAWVTTYLAIAAGEMATVTTDVPRITGHRATSLAQVLHLDVPSSGSGR